MTARREFLKATSWESDYVAPIGIDVSFVGYRGPFPTGNNEIDSVRTFLAHLFDASVPTQLGAIMNMVATADRLVLAWLPDRAVGVLAARSVRALGLMGWHVTLVATDPGFEGKPLLPQLVRVLANQEPVDFVSVITNEEPVYEAVARSVPGAAAHPDRAGHYGRRIRSIADAVIAQLPGASALPPLGPDLTWRGLLAPPGSPDSPDSPDSPGDEPGGRPTGQNRFRDSLNLSTADAAFVVGDLSGVIGMFDRARRGLLAVDVKHRVRSIAVTGTNGKTSTVEFGRQLSQAAGLEAASFGTLGAITTRGRARSARMEAGQRAIPQFADRLWALGHEVMWSEAYSYALSRGLFDHMPVDVAVLTQFGFDHFSMHHSLAAYWAAKERLFRANLRPDGTVVLDPSVEGADRILAIAEIRKLEVVTTGVGNTVEISDEGLRVGDRIFPCKVPITETVMIGNLELAVAANLALGLDPAPLAKGIETLQGPPGRYEDLDLGTPFRIVIDSAHNADALEASLAEWRAETPGRIMVVVASVGSADRSRWEPIGEVADVLADVVVVTDESPYQGDADRIREAIRQGCPRAIDIADRQAAIDWVVANAEEGDTVIVAGRADEDFLIDEHGSVSYPTDAELLADAVHRLLPQSGPGPDSGLDQQPLPS
jgi:UDP-N-acetylmuramoyl-L-alanyl-D-glutamate--2,6-diaminopimelate ligase